MTIKPASITRSTERCTASLSACFTVMGVREALLQLMWQPQQTGRRTGLEPAAYIATKCDAGMAAMVEEVRLASKYWP
jgi:hypothetical protein